MKDRIFKAFIGIDQVWDRIFKKLTKLWCKTTGKDNIALSRLLLTAGALGVIVGVIIRVQDTFDYIWAIIVVPLWIFYWYSYMKLCKELKGMQASPSDVMPVSFILLVRQFLVNRICIVAPLLLLESVFLITGHTVTDFGLMLFFAGCYTVWHGDIGGKSVFSKVKDAAKSAANKLKELVPTRTPGLIPAPVGV